MDSGWAAIIGAIAGAMGTISGALINSAVAARRQKKSEEPARRLLRQMLDANLPWRSIATLSNVIGADKATTTRLLLEIGARGSDSGEDWTLISRNPLPDRYEATDATPRETQRSVGEKH